jgi:hypothetical protein
MKLFLLTISSLFSTHTFCQKSKTVFEIDSLLQARPGFENYRYSHGPNEYSICDFRMDTTTGKLSTFRYTSEGIDTVTTDYFFINNYLVKAQSFKKEHKIPIGIYYFKGNKVFYKTGKNIKLVGKGYFKKIAPKYFQKQLGYIYFQYEYLNPSKKRFQNNVPKILADKRREIDKQNSY